MTIKDAEKLTGLTAKSIRYYESKGLIHVNRDKQNDYRNYTEEDIRQLKYIKVLRYLDFTIDEIAEVLQQKEEEIESILQTKSQQLEAESDCYLEKQRLCDALLKDSKKKALSQVIDDYSDTVEFLESSDGEEFTKSWQEMLCPNLSAVLLQSLVLAEPILWLFIRIEGKQWDTILGTSIAAIVSTALLVLSWVNYFRHRKKHKQMVKAQNQSNRLVLPVLLVTVVAAIVLCLLLGSIVERVLAPQHFLFYEFSPVAKTMMIVLLVVFLILVLAIVADIFKIKGMSFLDIYIENWKGMKRFRPLLLIAFLAGLYCCLTSVTFVTESEIICCSPLTPQGTSYTYAEVEQIETGFGDKFFAFQEYKKKGQFYYRIYLDEKAVVFHAPTVNGTYQRYAMDTYLELEELDSALVKLGIPKESSEENWKSCDLDEQYVNRFLRIIRNVSEG